MTRSNRSKALGCSIAALLTGAILVGCNSTSPAENVGDDDDRGVQQQQNRQPIDD